MIRQVELAFLPSKLYVCLTQEEFDHLNEQRMKKADQKAPYLTENAEATTHCGYDKEGKHTIAVCFSGDLGKMGVCEVAEIVAHEAYHVVQCIENHIAENEPGVEYPAYLMGYVVNKMMHEIGKDLQ